MSDEPKIPFIAHDGSMVAWYIYLHEGLFLGEYTSPMDPMGWLNQKKVFFSWVLSLKQPSHHLIPHYPTGN